MISLLLIGRAQMNGPDIYKWTHVYLIGILRIKVDQFHCRLKNQIWSTRLLASHSKYKSAYKTVDLNLNLKYKANKYKTPDSNLQNKANGIILLI